MSTVPIPASAPQTSPDPTDVAWKRVVAAVIDVGIGAAIAVPLFAVLSEEVYRFDATTRELVVSEQLDGFGAFVFYAWLLAYNVGVFVLQRGYTGRTVGTLLLGVAVVGQDGRPLGPANALVRSVAGVVDYLPCCLPLVGVITMFATRDHRRVGDMAARSYAIDAARMGHPVLLGAVAGGTALPGTGPIGPAPPAAPPPPVGWSSAPSAGWTPPGPPATSGPTTGGPAVGGPAMAGSRPPIRQMPPTAPPSTAPVRPPAPAASAPTPVPTPVWNAERGAYMAWDARRREWLQFDQATQRWLQYDLVRRRWVPLGPQ